LLAVDKKSLLSLLNSDAIAEYISCPPADSESPIVFADLKIHWVDSSDWEKGSLT
jgi:hypothetical protein